MSSTFTGLALRLSIFGQSHSEAIGMTLDGLPAGLPIDLDKLQAFLNRRAPGQNDWSTPRREEDRPEFLCGLKDGYTCTEEDVNNFCMELPKYKRPRKIIFASVPRNPTGKIEKPKLREMYRTEDPFASMRSDN